MQDDTSLDAVQQYLKTSQVFLKQKGDSASVSSNSCKIVLRWSSAVDLDLHCFVDLHSNLKQHSSSALSKIAKFFKEEHTEFEHIYYNDQGSKLSAPWVFLDGDAGVGDTGGDNEETLSFTDLSRIQCAYVIAHIYDKPDATFADYDGYVHLSHGAQNLTIPLSAPQVGEYCVIAKLELTENGPLITNINRTFKKFPSLKSL